jgi:hypothetical protein
MYNRHQQFSFRSLSGPEDTRRIRHEIRAAEVMKWLI